MPDIRDPKKEAQDFVNANISDSNISSDSLTAYVLEPSPPAIQTEPLFADLPLQIEGDVSNALTPTSAGGHNYNDFPALEEFASARWLGHLQPLPNLPDNWINKMEDTHRLAFSVISEARKQNNGKFGLRFVMGGFGTPFYGSDTQVRVVDGLIILQEGQKIKTEPVTTIKAASDFLGVAPTDTQREHDSPELGDIERHLLTDKECNDFLGAWFGLSTLVLEEMKLLDSEATTTPVQIWPGHFDAATEINAGKTRCTLGASPGDENHSEPYFYFSPHVEVDKSNPFFNAESFGGATLFLSQLPSSNQKQAVIDFFTTGIEFVKS